MIAIKALSHTYPGTSRQPPRQALAGLDLAVEPGCFAILSGPNGSGKSTLFRILCGLMRPSQGTIAIGGADLFADPQRARAQMGVVFQSPAVDKHLSVIENLRLQGALYGLSGAAFEERLAEAEGWSAIRERHRDRVETLSGGLARQLELVKCLLSRPRLLLLDEPTTGLDPASRKAFLDALHRLHKTMGLTILMTSHIFAEAEDADRVAILKDGRLLAYDHPAALRARLGREMLVIQCADPQGLGARIRAEFQPKMMCVHETELRLEEIDPSQSLGLLERILDRFRPEIASVAIKPPGLEDVFIHITGPAGVGPQGDRP
jgi:ABC-2 type transport system ATP-binding protein